MLTGNKGDWSEIYTLFKLLGEGEVYAGDEKLNKIENLFYPIIMILRNEREGSYNYRYDNARITIETSGGEILLTLPASEFLNQAEHLLSAIKDGESSFSVPQSESFMHKIKCHTLKATSYDKTDIHIILHDRRTKLNSEMGFSIKSQIGGNSTLLNAGKTTNFTFKISGIKLSEEDIKRINGIEGQKKIIKRIEAINETGGKLEFDHIDNQIFNDNLIMLDGDMPNLLASLLLQRFISNKTDIAKLIENLTKNNPLNYRSTDVHPYYEYKIKHLLTSVALGMMPGAVWNGQFDANGGYLIVKEDGEILCYHFYDRNRFENYLYNNAYLESASTTRHQYGIIETDDSGNAIFKLNLQIRLR